ncbi:BAG family molecular chaperone regulator 3-like [Primulina tabacum]|uniref:BAG family molecular chaperone regulator 3-like n=1 Tax=Primulina tabacum TaxID=48773 RepID=UPI003F5A9EB6
MMPMRTKNDALPPLIDGGAGGGGRDGGVKKDWELRPSGMLVQKRTDGEQNRVPPPTIRIRVKFGTIYHEVHISSRASFGELKKMLSGPTGLHHRDQKLFYKDKERDSNAFLDLVGVKDKSKIVLQEDPISQEKRYLEISKNAKLEKAAKLVSDISLEVDRLGGQVSAMETIVSKGGEVTENDVTKLVDSLMHQLVKLDGIFTADGDVKLQRKMQVKRVRKYVETLDSLKIKTTTLQQPTTNQQNQQQTNLYGHISSPMQPFRDSNGSLTSLAELQLARHSPKHQQLHQPSSRSGSGAAAIVITTQWETFDSTPTPSAPPSSGVDAIRPMERGFTWDLL